MIKSERIIKKWSMLFLNALTEESELWNKKNLINRTRKSNKIRIIMALLDPEKKRFIVNRIINELNIRNLYFERGLVNR
jgi:hypothetical protein